MGKRKEPKQPAPAERPDADALLQEAAQKREVNRERRQALVDDAGAQKRVREELIADLRRVSELEENRSIVSPVSQKEYRRLGYFPEILVSDFFGNHAEFLRAAGLHESRTTARSRNRAALIHHHQRIAEYARQHVLPWAGRYDKTAGRKHLEVVVASDLHSAFVDPFALDVLLASIRIVAPDVVVLNGDVWDFPQISRHRKLPGHFHLNLQQEIDFGRDRILRAVREAAPEATVYLVIGNHEHRLVTYLADAAPELACLRTLSFADLFGLDELEISLVCRSSFLAPTAAQKKRDVSENWVQVGGCYVATHGTSVSKFAADKQLDRFRLSGTSGHTHRPQVITANALGTGPLSWMSTPMMASFAVGRDYVAEPSAWQMGFGVASVETRRRLVSQQLVTVHESWASFAGHSWEPTAKALKERQSMVAA